MTVLYIEDNLPNIHLMGQVIGRRPQCRLLTAERGGSVSSLPPATHRMWCCSTSTCRTSTAYRCCGS
jgi:hypothetical protein